MTVSVKQPPKLKKRQLSLKQQKLHNFSLGSRGEKQALDFFRSHHFKILATNVRQGNHEVDIVALDTVVNEVVFCEVKTRSSNFYGNPYESVSKKKIASLNVVAQTFMKLHKLNQDYRFDILTIEKSEINHFENVTWGE